jgi:hypothetical protein
MPAPIALTSGAKLGPYEILSPLGAGDMGEVYRAQGHALRPDRCGQDTTRRFSSDSEAKQRFERVARTIFISLELVRKAELSRVEGTGSEVQEPFPITAHRNTSDF